MLERLIKNGFGKAEDYNCAECILNGANKAYSLGMSQEACKVAAAFGGGMGTGRVCGAVASALMVIGYKKTESVGRQSPNMKRVSLEYQALFEAQMGSLNCSDLKAKYYNDRVKCNEVIMKAAELLDTVMVEENDNES